jgi:hypothetical protein
VIHIAAAPAAVSDRAAASTLVPEQGNLFQRQAMAVLMLLLLLLLNYNVYCSRCCSCCCF